MPGNIYRQRLHLQQLYVLYDNVKRSRFGFGSGLIKGWRPLSNLFFRSLMSTDPSTNTVFFLESSLDYMSVAKPLMDIYSRMYS